MINVTVLDPQLLTAFWLCFSRWLAALILIPLLNESAIPIMIKVLSAIVLTYAFFPGTSSSVIQDIEMVGLGHFWILTFFYTLTGLAIGFTVQIIMHAFMSAGSLISNQIGFTTVNMLDPSSMSQVGPFEMLIKWVLTMLLLASGVLLPIFQGLYQSFESLTLGNFNFGLQYYEHLNLFLKNLFIIALSLAAPLLFMNLLVNSILGILARIIPQMNIFMISFVVNIGLGLLVMYFISDEFFEVAFQGYVKQLAMWFKLVS